MEKKHYTISLALIFSLIMGSLIASDVTTTGKENWKGEAFELHNKVSSTGGEITSNKDYRFSEYNDSILYGPYEIENSPYFVHKGRVLNSDLNEVEKSEALNLHKFYLKTYLDPLFYSPSEEAPKLARFERFEKTKILSKVCDLEYNVIPEEYFSELEKNHNTTKSFLNRASEENAEKLVEQNLNTTKSYSGFVADYIEVLQKDVSKNECFKETAENNGFASVTDTPTSYRIDSRILEGYIRMANNNSEQLATEINHRKDLLTGEKELEIEEVDLELKNKSFNYEKEIDAETAKEKFNFRRKEEYVSLNDNDEGGEEAEGKDDVASVNLTKEEREKHGFVEKTPQSYDIQPYCMERDTVPLYGWDKNVYPNVMLGQEIFFEDNENFLKDFFTACRCPYVEVTRLKWYNIDDLFQRISVKPLSSGENNTVDEAETIFIENPGEDHLGQLSESYEQKLKQSIRNDEYRSDLPEMWRRNQKHESKLDVFESAYDDFWNDYHMDIWRDYFPIDKDSKYEMPRYGNFLMMESGYPMTFMTWSESVWRLDEKPKKIAAKVGENVESTSGFGTSAQ